MSKPEEQDDTVKQSLSSLFTKEPLGSNNVKPLGQGVKPLSGPLVQKSAPANIATPKNQLSRKEIDTASSQAGFPRRSPTKSRRKGRRRSPNTEFFSVRCRPEAVELFKELSGRHNKIDAGTLEQAIIALAEKNGDTDIVEEMQALINANPYN